MLVFKPVHFCGSDFICMQRLPNLYIMSHLKTRLFLKCFHRTQANAIDLEKYTVVCLNQTLNQSQRRFILDQDCQVLAKCAAQLGHLKNNTNSSETSPQAQDLKNTHISLYFSQFQGN